MSSPARPLFLGKVITCDLLELFSENPIKILHVVWVNGNEFDAKVMIAGHFVFHRTFIFLSIVVILHAEHSPILDINIVVWQIKIRATYFFRKNPNSSPNFFLVLVAEAYRIKIIGNQFFRMTANLDAKFGDAMRPVLFAGTYRERV